MGSQGARRRFITSGNLLGWECALEMTMRSRSVFCTIEESLEFTTLGLKNGRKLMATPNQSLETLSEEEWRVVPNTNGLILVSSKGRVKSAKRVVRKRHSSGVIIEQTYEEKMHRCPIAGGYRCTHFGVNGKKRSAMVHALVLEAFIGPRPDGMEACHYDGDSLNNDISNLRWDTHFNNNQDRKRVGRYASGDSHPMARLSKDVVLKIINGEISAKEAGVSKSHFWRIKSGQSWRELSTIGRARA